jgi:hypothetical protein
VPQVTAGGIGDQSAYLVQAFAVCDRAMLL